MWSLSSKPNVVVSITTFVVLVLMVTIETTTAQYTERCRCIAKFENFYNRRRLLSQQQQQRNHDDERNLALKILAYDYTNYYIDRDGYYVVEGVTVLPNNDPLCNGNYYYRTKTANARIGSNNDNYRTKSASAVVADTPPRNGILKQIFGGKRTLSVEHLDEYENDGSGDSDRYEQRKLHGMGSMKSSGKDVYIKSGKGKGKGKGKGIYCGPTDTSPACLPDIFPCPVPPLIESPSKSPSESPSESPSAPPSFVPTSKIIQTKCPDGSPAPSNPNNCTVLCPGNGTFFDGCRTPCPTDGSTRPTNCVDVCTTTSNNTTNCVEACCRISTTTKSPSKSPTSSPISVPTPTIIPTTCPDGSPAPLNPNNCTVLCTGNGTIFDGCRTPCPTDGSPRPTNCVDVCTTTSNNATNCVDACCRISTTTKYCINFDCGEGYQLRQNPQTRLGNDRATCCYRQRACAGAPTGSMCSLADINSSLIPNPSFENHTGCPTGLAGETLNLSVSWMQATDATSDYIIVAPTCDDQIWRNGFAVDGVGAIPQNASDGDAFVGCFKAGDYYEYIGACLNGTMVAGVEYTFELDVAAALSNYAFGGDTNGVTELLCIPTCDLFPIPGYDYKGDDFEVLATAAPVGGLIGGGVWKTITFNFVATSNCSAIMFGPGLDQTIQSDQSGSYVLYDFLNLQEGAAGVCNNNSECVPQP